MKAREDGRRRGVSQARKASRKAPVLDGGVLDLPQEENATSRRAKTHSIPVNRPHTHLVVRRRHGDDRKMGFSMRVVVGACFLFVGVVRSDEAPRVVADMEEGSLAWLEDEAIDATLLDLEGAARAGDPRAHHKLGEASLHGAGSRPQDFRAAAGHFIASGFPESLHAASRAPAKARSEL